MTEFKVGDWVRHSVYGIGRIVDQERRNDNFYAVFPWCNATGWYVPKRLKKLIPKFQDFESLFLEEIERSSKFKVGDKVKITNDIPYTQFTFKKGAIFTIEKIFDDAGCSDPFITATYENDFISCEMYISFNNVELYLEDENEKVSQVDDLSGNGHHLVIKPWFVEEIPKNKSNKDNKNVND